VPPIAPRHSRLIDQLQIRFVDEAGRRQRSTPVPNRELVARDDTELLVYDRHESIERVTPAASQLVQHIHAASQASKAHPRLIPVQNMGMSSREGNKDRGSVAILPPT
jgi:hypothetical protein